MPHHFLTNDTKYVIFNLINGINITYGCMQSCKYHHFCHVVLYIENKAKALFCLSMSTVTWYKSWII